MDDSEVIAAFVRSWLSSPDSPMPWLAPEAEWVRPLAQEHRAAPLYLGWTATVFARENGAVWLLDTEWGTGWSPASAFLRRMALKRASVGAPALLAILPIHPEGAAMCDHCGGTGRLREPFICTCGGYGWLIPGEDRGMGIG